MKVRVCGGRGFHRRHLAFRELDKLHEQYNFTELMQGGAKGADAFAEQWAKQYPKIKRHEIKADWDLYGKAAGFIRNRSMIKWGPDLVVAFPGGPGTAMMIRIAEEAGVNVIKVLQND